MESLNFMELDSLDMRMSTGASLISMIDELRLTNRQVYKITGMRRKNLLELRKGKFQDYSCFTMYGWMLVLDIFKQINREFVFVPENPKFRGLELLFTPMDADDDEEESEEGES